MKDKMFFPDGITEISDWFYDDRIPSLEELGKKYRTLSTLRIKTVAAL